MCKLDWESRIVSRHFADVPDVCLSDTLSDCCARSDDDFESFEMVAMQVLTGTTHALSISRRSH